MTTTTKDAPTKDAPTKIAGVIEKLRKVHAARKDVLDLPKTWTLRQVERYRADTMALAALISQLGDLPSQIARLQARLDPLFESRARFLAEEQATLEQIAAAPDFRTIADARLRDQEENRQLFLQQHLKLLRDGGLLVTGERQLPLTYLELQIKEVSDRCDRLRLQLDACERDGELIASQPASS